MTYLKAFAKVEFKVLLIAGVGGLLQVAITYGLTHFLHAYYVYSDITGLCASFQWNMTANVYFGNIQVKA